jgi:hypothetical protein
MEKVFYAPGERWVIDFAIKRADGVTVTQIQGQTLEQVQARHPGAQLMSYQEAEQQIEAGCKTAPRRIDREDFDYALNVLPPVRWDQNGKYETFLMSERTNGRVTGIYARVKDSYWKFEDVCTLSHVEIIAKVREAMKTERNAPEADEAAV